MVAAENSNKATRSPASSSDLQRPVTEEQIRTDVRRLLTFVLILLLGVLVSSSAFPPNPIGFSLTLLFYAFLVIAYKSWTGAFVLVLVQVPLFAVAIGRRDVTPTVDELVLAFQMLLMVGLICRLHSPVGVKSSLLQTLKSLASEARSDKAAQRKNSEVVVQTVREFALQTVLVALGLLAVVLLSAFILNQVPLNPEFRSYARSHFRLTPSGLRLILIGFLLFLCVLASLVVVSEISFRKLSPREASMYLRSQVFMWLHRDFRMIVRKHRKVKRKTK